ncbi:MAG: transcriptional coactivator p15/PC4 family protein [Candidatus Thiodiazotropha sp.]
MFDSRFNDKTYVHLRELVFKDNCPIPTSKGIALTLERCNELFKSLPMLDIHVEELSRNESSTFFRNHLGGNWFVTVQSGFNCVDIRKFWLPENAQDICASRKGVSLTFDQFRELKSGLRAIPSFVTELWNMRTCYEMPGHDATQCEECSPNTAVPRKQKCVTV